MPASSDHEPVSFLGRRLSSRFTRRIITLAPGHQRHYDEAEWHDAIIIVEDGEIDLEDLHGQHFTFRPGNILSLTSMPLRTLRCTSREPAVLAVVSRKRTPGRPR